MKIAEESVERWRQLYKEQGEELAKVRKEKETHESDLERSIKKINAMNATLSKKEGDTDMKSKMIRGLQEKLIDIEAEMKRKEAFRINVGV